MQPGRRERKIPYPRNWHKSSSSGSHFWLPPSNPNHILLALDTGKQGGEEGEIEKKREREREDILDMNWKTMIESESKITSGFLHQTLTTSIQEKIFGKYYWLKKKKWYIVVQARESNRIGLDISIGSTFPIKWRCWRFSCYSLSHISPHFLSLSLSVHFLPQCLCSTFAFFFIRKKTCIAD